MRGRLFVVFVLFGLCLILIFADLLPVSGQSSQAGQAILQDAPDPRHGAEGTRTMPFSRVEAVPIIARLAARVSASTRSVQPVERMPRSRQEITLTSTHQSMALKQPASGRGLPRSTSASVQALVNCTVDTTADAGPGSLRQCMLDATAGTTITFSPAAFPPGSPATISLLTALPPITLDNITINAAGAGVILDGSGLVVGDGFVIDGANGVVIQGLQINNFSVFDGVVLKNGATNALVGGSQPGQGNSISGNRAGVQLRDSQTMSNTIAGNTITNNTEGVLIHQMAKNNTVGGTVEGARNVIGDNLFGVSILDAGTSGNQVAGNYIGTNAAGTAAHGNAEGVDIEDGATGNIIGGSENGAGNLISGNTDIGVTLAGFGTSGNQVLGNLIGTNAAGTAAIGNGAGVAVLPGATGNHIGGGMAGGGNTISGNIDVGVQLEGPNTSQNKVMGNYIGTDLPGTKALANPIGIAVAFTAQNNVIGGPSAGEGNVISGNTTNGIQFQSVGTSGNQVLGNFIGTEATGTAALGNQFGILLGFFFDGVQNNVIGGESEGARNIISGNTNGGIVLYDATTSGNEIKGNYIGIDATGTKALGNGIDGLGVGVAFGPQDNIIGGLAAGAGNVISGNAGGGIAMGYLGADGNQVLGNLIGTDPTGTVALGNGSGLSFELGATNNVVGGMAPGARNLISGNDFGVRFISADTVGNQIIGNYIGTNISGTMSLGNSTGIVVASGASNTLISGNLISGNGGVGIQIQESGTTNNQIQGNYIGTGAAGLTRLGNEIGIGIGFGAQNNVVGGSVQAARNVIGGNRSGGVVIQDNGTSGNKVLGNYIGVNLLGTAPVSNTWGVVMLNGAGNNLVGGSTAGTANVISGNSDAGVNINGASTTNNQVLGNLIGTSADGATAVPNGTGIYIYLGAKNNLIGGDGEGAGNLVSGNSGSGVLLEDNGTSGNQIAGNRIGIMGLGNGSAGIFLADGVTTNTIGVSNTIAYNGAGGVAVTGGTTLNNTITRNSLHHNSGGPVTFVNIPDPVPAPSLTYSVDDSLLSGTTCSHCTVEIFANPSAVIAGFQFLETVTAGAQGQVSVNLVAPGQLPYLTVTVTEPGGTTSEFWPVESTSMVEIYLPLVVR